MRLIDFDPGDRRLLTDVFPVLAELRTELTPAEFESIYAEGHPQGLRYTAAYDESGRCLAVAGWRVITTTVALRKLYIDDLVTATVARSTGVGSALLADLMQRARAAGCSVLDLDSAVHRAEAHRFYFRERMAITALHFTSPLD